MATTPLFAAQDGDNDEVRAALVTAASYHRHHQYDHSLRWLRHAAQLAAEAGRTHRSHELHASAQQLDDMVGVHTHRDPTPPTVSSPDTSQQIPSTVMATHRTPYSYIQSRRQPRIRLDSPTAINVTASTMRTPSASMDDEPPSLLGHATVQASVSPETMLNGAPPHMAGEDDDAVALDDDEFLIVDEPTRTSNTPETAFAPMDLGKTVTAVQDDSPASEKRTARMMRQSDDDVATLTTQAPLRVAVVADQSGSARIVMWENKSDVPEGAMLGLLIPVDPKQRRSLNALISGKDDGPESM